MQKQLIFTVYDQKAESFLPPFFVPSIGLATRAFTDCVNSESHQFAKHPADYTLFQLGDWDDQTAEFNCKTKKSMGNGVEYIDINNEHSLGDFQNGAQNSPIQSDKNRGDPA